MFRASADVSDLFCARIIIPLCCVCGRPSEEEEKKSKKLEITMCECRQVSLRVYNLWSVAHGEYHPEEIPPAAHCCKV